MDVNQLQLHVLRLAHLPESESPVLSCYLNLENGTAKARDYLRERAGHLRTTHSGRERELLLEAIAQVERYLDGELGHSPKGVAIFARSGSEPLFVPLEFQVPVPNWVAAGKLPNIYHLVELKDTYERYIVVLLSEERACILEVHLGEITREVWTMRPDLRRRVGREWTKQHYQRHMAGRRNQFLNEQVDVLNRLVSERHYAHIILAGEPRMTAGFRKRLPKHLAGFVVDTVPASSRDRASDVVSATLTAFVEEEERESQAIAERLIREINANGLGVAGVEPSLRALQQMRADVLVLATGFDPPPGRRCSSCGYAVVADPARERCPSCHSESHIVINLREEMVRLAERGGCGVEVVEHCDAFLKECGGVGCLIRYRDPSEYGRVRPAEDTAGKMVA